MPRTVLVVGGGVAGISAARAARAADPAATVVMYAADLPTGADEPRRALAAAGVELRAAAVRSIDGAARTLTADGADPVAFDALVLTDGRPAPSELAGSELAGVVRAGDLPNAGTEAGRAVVLGATPAGLAAVAELLARGVETHLVEPAGQLLPGLADPDVVAPVAELLATAGVHLHLHTAAAELLGAAGRLTALRTAAGDELPADLAVLAADGPPDTALARAAGLATAANGRVAVDDRLRTSVPRVYAAGGLAAVAAPTSSHRHAQGRAAGANAAGADRRYHPGFVPWCVAAGQGLLGGAGYGEAAAAEHGLRPVLARAVGISRARYYPGVQQVAVKLLAEPGSLRLIGAQVHGSEGVRERAMFLATAVRLGLTLTDLSTMENVYSPAIGALNEPIVVAATNGLAELATAS